MIACVIWLSLLGATMRRARQTVSFSLSSLTVIYSRLINKGDKTPEPDLSIVFFMTTALS